VSWLTVVITWMDGQQESYQCQHATVRDGVLWLDFDRYPRSDEPARRFPLDNIRHWSASEL
jgi:hypothetical protein